MFIFLFLAQCLKESKTVINEVTLDVEKIPLWANILYGISVAFLLIIIGILGRLLYKEKQKGIKLCGKE